MEFLVVKNKIECIHQVCFDIKITIDVFLLIFKLREIHWQYKFELLFH